MARSRPSQEALMALALEDSQTTSELPDMVVDYLDLLLQDATEPLVNEVSATEQLAPECAPTLMAREAPVVATEALAADMKTAPQVATRTAPETLSLADIEAAAEAAFAALDAPARVDAAPVPSTLAPVVEMPMAQARSAPPPAEPPALPIEDDTAKPQFDDDSASGAVSLAPISDDMEISCLRVRVAGILLLVPMDQVLRVQEIDVPRRFEGICVPELPSNKACLLTCADEGPGIYVDKVEGVERVLGERVLWRHETSRCPWFIGTHKDLLCRVFDPERMLAESLHE